jgi:hypothetical protein
MRQVSIPSFEHISVLSFMPLEPFQLPRGVVVSGKTVDPQWQEAFPLGKFQAHESGSVTARTFVWFVEQCCLFPMQERLGPGVPFILMLDSGGGSWMHLGVELSILCHRYNCKLFYLPAHTTKALCALDQTPHATMARLWALTKHDWAVMKSTMSKLAAIAMLNVIVDTGLSPQNSVAGWARVGIETGKVINRDKVLVDRRVECFASTGKECKPDHPILAALQAAAFHILVRKAKALMPPPDLEV